MTQVKEMTNQELNRKLAELMGYTVFEFDGKLIIEECTEGPARYIQVPDYCNDLIAVCEVEKAALEADNSGYVRNISIVKWSAAVDPKEVADWTSIDIQGVSDLFTATPRERAEAAYQTLQEVQHDGDHRR